MRYGFKDVVVDSRTGLNPRKNFVLGNGENNYITIKDIYNGQINITDKTDKVDDEAIQIIKKRSRIRVGDILFVSIGRIGETAIVENKDDTWDVNESVFVFTVNRKIITPEYFCMLFQTVAVQKYLAGNSSGSTFKSIKMNQLEKMVFDLPSLEVQEDITAKLSKVKAICAQRTSELTCLDDLIKARFVEMFGDPVSDPKNWGQKPLKEMLESIRYGTSTPPEFSDEGYAFIRATNIKNGCIVDNDMKFIPQHEADRLEKCKLLGGEIIIVRSGVNAGDTCVVTPKYTGQYAGYDMILVLNELLNPVFLNTLINTTYMEKIVKPMTRRAAQPHLNSEQAQSFPIICVPREHQDRFADFVEQVDKSKSVIQKSLEETQMLFDSLMQCYFG